MSQSPLFALVVVKAFMRRRFVVPFLCLACVAAAAELENNTALAPVPAPTPARNQPASDDALYDLGKSLFEQYAPAEVKEQYDFPTKERWDEFAVKLQRALDGDSFADLAAYEPQARAALVALRSIPGCEDQASWLEERLELITAAKQIVQPPPVRPGTPPPPPTRVDLPQYELWLERLRATPVPAAAEQFLPLLLAQFAAEGTPRELVWLAEVESMFNASARSPAGARGLFQLMPATAKGLGLSTWMPDDRTDPTKSAQAAARLLKRLYSQFGDWPLALAAYNAGEGRVSRALAARKAKTFAEIASGLSVETRLYVPKVCATVALRTGVTPEKLASPR